MASAKDGTLLIHSLFKKKKKKKHRDGSKDQKLGSVVCCSLKTILTGSEHIQKLKHIYLPFCLYPFMEFTPTDQIKVDNIGLLLTLNALFIETQVLVPVCTIVPC